MDIPLWKFVTEGLSDKTTSCVLYHFYDAKNVHKRSVTYKGVKTIWRHFLKWDSKNNELIYYDGRESKEKSESFREVIPMTKCVQKNNKLYINIQPRDMLIWTWCLDLDMDTIELRQWERKVCKFCDPKVRIHRNGCYDFRYVEESHKDDCPYKNNIPKMGLQDKHYYVKRTPQEASTAIPLDLRLQKKDVFVWDDPWGVKLNGKQELTDGRKYMMEKNTDKSYSRLTEKSDDDKIKQSIREVINKGSIYNVEGILNFISSFEEIWVHSFISKYLYSTYRTVPEYPHVELIKKLQLSSKTWELFKDELFGEEICESSLKFKCCLIAILYKDNLLDKRDVQETLASISTPIQAGVIIYFFHWDTNHGLFIGLVHNSIKEFESTINKLQELSDSLQSREQFAIEDLITSI